MVFEAKPKQATAGSSIVQVFQLNARVLLRPPKSAARPAFHLSGIRGEQSGVKSIRLLAAFENTGNIALRPHGAVTVRNSLGQVRFRGPLSELEVFPGATVELGAELAEPVLPAGRYEVVATVTAAGRKESISAPLELFGPNELPTRKAELLTLTYPQAYVDGDLTVTATYRNTGNVPFAPRATLVAGSAKPIEMATEQVPPGETGTARASVHLAGLQSRELTVRIFAEGRELDSRTASVTPLPRPSLADRLQDWILAHALLLVGGLAALVLAMMATLALVLVRRGRRRGRSEDDGLELLARLPTVTPPPRPQQASASVPAAASEEEEAQASAAAVSASEANSRDLEAGVAVSAAPTAAAHTGPPELTEPSQTPMPLPPVRDPAKSEGRTTLGHSRPALETSPESTGSPMAGAPGDVLRHRAESSTTAPAAGAVPAERRAAEFAEPRQEPPPILPKPEEAELDRTPQAQSPPPPLFETPPEWSGSPAVAAQRGGVPGRREEVPTAAPAFAEAPAEGSARPQGGPNGHAPSGAPVRSPAQRLAPGHPHGISTGAIVLTGAAAVTLLILERRLRR